MADLDRRESEVTQEIEEHQEMLWRGLQDPRGDLVSLGPRELMVHQDSLGSRAWLD